MKGDASLEAIAKELKAKVPRRFPTLQESLNYVANLSKRFSRWAPPDWSPVWQGGVRHPCFAGKDEPAALAYEVLASLLMQGRRYRMMCLPKSDDYTRRSETDRFLSANESEEESGSALLGLVLRRTLRSDRRTWLFL